MLKAACEPIRIRVCRLHQVYDLHKDVVEQKRKRTWDKKKTFYFFMDTNKDRSKVGRVGRGSQYTGMGHKCEANVGCLERRRLQWSTGGLMGSFILLLFTGTSLY